MFTLAASECRHLQLVPLEICSFNPVGEYGACEMHTLYIEHFQTCTELRSLRWCIPVMLLNTISPESRCALRLRYVDLVVCTEVAVEVCCCFSVFSC
jgi:hypothetical protein